MITPLFVYHPRLAAMAFKIIWVIPVVLIPASIVIYFTEGRNIIQFVTIIGFALGLSGLLYGLLKLADKRTIKMGLEISENGELKIIVGNKETSIPLAIVDSIKLSQTNAAAGLVPIATLIVVHDKNNETKNFAFPGSMPKNVIGQLESTLSKFKVRLS